MSEWFFSISMYVVWALFLFLLAFGPTMMDYAACTSIPGNGYGGFPPHCIWPSSPIRNHIITGDLS